MFATLLSFGWRFHLGPEAKWLAETGVSCKTACVQLASKPCPVPLQPALAKLSAGCGSSRALFLAAWNGWEQSCLCPAPCYLSKAALKFVLTFLFSRDVELKIKPFKSGKSGSRLNNLGQGIVSDALQETQSVVNLISSCISTKFS